MRLNFIIGYNGYSFVLVLGHELVTKVCLFVAFLDLRSRTLYKRQLLQYIDIVGVVFSLSGFVQLFSDPPGIQIFHRLLLNISCLYCIVYCNGIFLVSNLYDLAYVNI